MDEDPFGPIGLHSPCHLEKVGMTFNDPKKQPGQPVTLHFAISASGKMQSPEPKRSFDGSRCWHAICKMDGDRSTKRMITSIPWPELATTAKRIVRTGCVGHWTSNLAVDGAGSVRVRCYTTSNFGFATIVACQSDLPKLLAGAGRLRISSTGDEIVLLNFQPTVATLLSSRLGGMVFLPQCASDLSCFPNGSKPALIFGRVDSVELHIPSHAIDVIAPLWAPRRIEPAMFPFGLN